MKKFFANYSFYAVKMFVNQFAVSLLGLTMSLVFFGLKESNPTVSTIGQLISSISAVIFYLFLIYNMTWNLGYEDHIAVGHGKREYRPLNGLYISLLANSLNFILALLALFGIALGLGAIFIEGMYAGIMLTVANALDGAIPKFMYFAIIVPVIPVASISYYLGLKDIRFFPNISLHKSSKKGKKNNV